MWEGDWFLERGEMAAALALQTGCFKRKGLTIEARHRTYGHGDTGHARRAPSVSQSVEARCAKRSVRLDYSLASLHV